VKLGLKDARLGRSVRGAAGRDDEVRVDAPRSGRDVVVRSVRNRLSFAKRESADEESLLKFFILIYYYAISAAKVIYFSQ
jgi:hypothetical protein